MRRFLCEGLPGSGCSFLLSSIQVCLLLLSISTPYPSWREVYAIIAWNFLIWYYFECCCKWIDAHSCLRAFFESLQLFFHVVYPFGFSIMILSVPIFCSKIVLISLLLVVGMSSHILSLLAGRVFSHCFGMSCFVSFVWSYDGIFLVFLLSPVPRVVLFLLIVIPCSFCPNILFFSSVFDFLLVFSDFLFVFPVYIPIQVLNFCSSNFSWSNFAL